MVYRRLQTFRLQGKQMTDIHIMQMLSLNFTYSKKYRLKK